MRNHRLTISAAILLVVAVLVGRMIVYSRLELARAEASSNRRIRVQHLRRAAAYYLPGSPWVRQAVQALIREAKAAETARKPAHALHTWRALRSAIMQLRGLSAPYSEHLPMIHRRIVALSALDTDAKTSLRTAEGRKKLLERLDKPRSPRAGYVALGLVGFCLWVGGAFALLFVGLKADGSRKARRFWPLLSAVALGVLLFALGLGAA